MQLIKWTTEGVVKGIVTLLNGSGSDRVFNDATLALTMRGMLVPCERGMYIQSRWYREYTDCMARAVRPL